MKEQTALAYVNMYGVLGSLEELCRMDDKAKEILQTLRKPVALCFSVKEGPVRTFRFSREGCKITEGADGCTAKMRFSSPAAFNAMIDTGKPGMPVKNLVGTLAFLAGTFTALTDRLSAVLQPSESDLADPAFYEENTLMTLYVIAGAISALANHDSISGVSAAGTVDGDMQIRIPEKAVVTLRVKDHIFETIKAETPSPRAVLQFADIPLAHRLFDGTAATMSEMCAGNVRVSGIVSMIDNVNRILDRVSVYLA